MHLFWYCKEVALFWIKTEEWISVYNTHFCSCPLTVMLGDLKDGVEGRHLNNTIIR